jgi:hypothetical protein
MYVFGIDIPLNVLMTISLGLHVIELLLVIAILRRLARRHEP